MTLAYCFQAVDEMWLLQRLEELEQHGQRIDSMRLFEERNVNRNVMALMTNYMTITQAMCVRQQLSRVLSFCF